MLRVTFNNGLRKFYLCLTEQKMISVIEDVLSRAVKKSPNKKIKVGSVAMIAAKSRQIWIDGNRIYPLASRENVSKLRGMFSCLDYNRDKVQLHGKTYEVDFDCGEDNANWGLFFNGHSPKDCKKTLNSGVETRKKDFIILRLVEN